MIRWMAAGASVPGTAHEKDGTPCQDKIGIRYSKGVSCATLADGAGFSKNSQFGAKIAVDTTLRFLTSRFDELYQTDSPAISFPIITHVENELNRYAEQKKLTPRELSSTLLFVAVKGTRYIAGHLGDGLIVSVNDGIPVVFSHPERGEFANQTYFTMNKDSQNHLRIYQGEVGTVSEFILMSDGSAESLYERSTGKLALAIERLVTWFRDNTVSEMVRIIEMNLNTQFRKRTGDDCSLILLQAKMHTTKTLSLLPESYIKEYLGVCRIDGMKNRLRILSLLEKEEDFETISRVAGLTQETLAKHIHQIKQLGIEWIR